MIFKNGELYEGDYVNDLKHGFGKYTFSDGKIYEGEWKNGNWDGKGK
jgi:hypothetical protein